MLHGLRIVVDVQHVFREGSHRTDRGAVYRLEDGSKLTEADCALRYGSALAVAMRGYGATVWENDPGSGILVGPYSRRQAAANTLLAHAYLACHLNAGRGDYALAEYMDSATLSVPLAQTIVDALRASIPEVVGGHLNALGERERGAVCVRGFTRGPAVLLEPLFGDQPRHQPLLDLTGLQRVGEAIARGVVDWWTTHRKGYL